MSLDWLGWLVIACMLACVAALVVGTALWVLYAALKILEQLFER
jgi:hypothetical protein